MSAYPGAIAEKGTIGALYVSELMAGKSFNNFGAAKPSDQPIENAIIPQPAISESLDGIAEWTGILPSHINIDVDGPESSVIRGAARTLSRPRLKIVCIEDNGPEAGSETITALLEAEGFYLDLGAGENAFFKR